MTSRGLPSIAKRVSAVDSYLLGSTRISRTGQSLKDYNSVVVGLTLWFGVILDYSEQFCESNENRRNAGRIYSYVDVQFSRKQIDLTNLFIFLDQVSDVSLRHLSDVDGFKGDLFLKELKTVSVETWLVPLKGIICAVITACFNGHNGGEVQGVKAVRQISCFLKKLEVDRPDLVEACKEDFHKFEDFLAEDVPVRRASDGYKKDVAQMRNILHSHLGMFSLEPFVPGHGPGAVANPEIKCWDDKHLLAQQDKRIGYLLSRANLGEQKDYLPMVKEDGSTRTSRYVCVPKTWKKLRGISAEPAELQFFQQGVLYAFDDMFHRDPWWRRRIDLHDQTKSRYLALKASSTGDFATVDLSAASDSVTLQLVRDLFGNSLPGRWLIGTRSVYTMCDDTIRRIHKFAPMGSSCCFPVECIVFCLAAEVAVRRTRKPCQKLTQVRVFGDDIIIPSYAVDELFVILSNLGFTVNTEKSYWTGSFREACGIEGWHGINIAPCRFKKLHSGVDSMCTDFDELASCIAFANELNSRNLHRTRAFLLEVLLKKELRASGSRFRAQDALFATFSGERGSLASPMPTNFQLRKRFSKHLWCRVIRIIVWQKRFKTRRSDQHMMMICDVCEYVTWLIRHQPGVRDYGDLWSKGWIAVTDHDPRLRLPLGAVMVPTVKWVVPNSPDFLDN